MFGNISYPCKHYHSDISIIEINQSNVSDSENIKIRHSERMLSHTILCNIFIFSELHQCGTRTHRNEQPKLVIAAWFTIQYRSTKYDATLIIN